MNAQQAGGLNGPHGGGHHGQGLNAPKKNNRIFVLILLIFIFVEYYFYVFEVMPKYKNPENDNLISNLLIVFHILVCLVLASLFCITSTNPGEVPQNWGLHVNDDESKRKRYCLICNAFKPERSHHCSVCDKCILNMNLHCPWVNNCIGFYNRKFFMQLLLYGSISSLCIVITEGYLIIGTYFKYYSGINLKKLHIICYIVILIVTYRIMKCTIFQFKLVLKNSTSIESLDEDSKNYYAKFNIGCKQNWEQVFGKNPLLWFCPLPLESGKPVGDGLTWKIKED